jgi:hypothetical protein
MDLSADKIAELRVKQLEMLQAIVARLAGNGATIKNYCITIVAAICGFAVTLQRPAVAIVAFLPLCVFALIDAQFLRTERRFRNLFDKRRSEPWAELPSFEINTAVAPPSSYPSALFSWSIFIFYVPLAIGVAVVVLIARSINGHL